MRRALLMIGLAACGARQTPAVHPDPVRIEIERAEDAEKARQHDQAAAHYKAAIAAARTPKEEAWARHELAETLATWGELAQAIAELEAAARATPDDPSVWQDLGILRHKMAQELGPSRPKNWLDAPAIEALAKAKALAPRDRRPRIALAALYWSAGDKPHALAEYKALLDLDLPDRVREKVRWAIGVLEKP
jgi:tetratricopeptide (TPR) repeat protein